MKIQKQRLSVIVMSTLLMTAFAGGCKKDNYKEIQGVCPTIISTNPDNQATGVPLGQVVTATFNEAMDPASITSSSFSLRGLSTVSGKLTYNESNYTLSFVPDAKLDQNTTYTATVHAPVTDLMGSALQTDYSWTFSTGDTVAPMVIATDPLNNQTGVPVNKTVEAAFSTKMDPSTINSSTFIIRQGANVISGAISYFDSTASFNPTASFDYNTTYTATLTTGVKSAGGQPLQNNYVWSFTTLDSLTPFVTQTDPLDNETGVVLNKVIKATFNMPMNPATINNLSFTLKQGAVPVNGTVTYSGSTASFTPTSPLAPNTLFTATITNAAANNNGIPMTNNHNWTFRTVNNVPPQIVSTDPADNATGVPVNKVVQASFNMAMDPLTLNTTTVTLKQGATPITGTVTYLGNTVSFTPSAPLTRNTVYTGTITTGAKNIAGVALANNYIWTFRTIADVDLKSVARFGIISGAGVMNNAGFSEIRNMDVGISPGVRSSITGFPPALVINGAIYASDDIAPPGVAAMLTQAKQDLMDAYLYAEGASFPAPATVSGDLGGITLTPGIYKTNSTLLIQAGNLTLDAQGDPNAVWIFQIASGFTTVGGAGGNILLIGGAKASNVYWQTGSSATIGDNTIFKGTIMALTSITMNSGAVAEGRMLAINGSVVMTNTNIITKP